MFDTFGCKPRSRAARLLSARCDGCEDAVSGLDGGGVRMRSHIHDMTDGVNGTALHAGSSARICALHMCCYRQFLRCQWRSYVVRHRERELWPIANSH